MLLNDILEEKSFISETLMLLEAESDLKQAIIVSLKNETKDLTVAPKIDELAKKILNSYIDNIRDNISNKDRYFLDKKVLNKISVNDFPKKNAERYKAIFDKNKDFLFSYVEKEIKKQLSIPYTNEWVLKLFSDKPYDGNDSSSVTIKRPKQLSTSNKTIAKKAEDFKPKQNEKISKKDFILQVFDIYKKEVGVKSIGQKMAWIAQHLSIELDQKNNNTPRPKCDDIVSADGINGFEVEYKKVTNPLQKSQNMFDMKDSGAILYADIMKVSTYTSKLEGKDIDLFEEFFSLLKKTFRDEAIKLASSTIRGKNNYLVFGTYMSAGKPHSSAAIGSDFLIVDRGPKLEKPNSTARWELGITRKAKNLKDLPDDMWNKMNDASKGDTLENYLKAFYDRNSQNRIASGFGLEKFLKKETSKKIIHKSLLDVGFKEETVSKNPENKLKFVFRYEGKLLFTGKMDFRFGKKVISPLDGGSPPKPPIVVDFKTHKKEDDKNLEHDHGVNMNKKLSSIDTDDLATRIAKELLTIKKGKN